MFTRRTFLKGLGVSAVAGGFALAGCAPGGTSGSTEPDGTVRFSWWGNDVRTKLTQQAIELFEQKQPDITVSGEPADWGGYWDKLATSTAGGDAPDMMQQVDPYIIEYGQRGALADVKEFGDVLDLSPFSESVLATGTIDGKVYGVPVGLSAPAFWVNPKVLQGVGEKVPDDQAWSWEDYAVLCERIAKKSSGKIAGSGQLTFDEQTFTVFARQHDQNLWNGKQLGFTQDLLVEWYEYVLRLQETGAALNAEKSVEAQGASIEASPMVLGKIAFTFGWANQLSQAQKAGSVSLNLAHLPGDGRSTVGAYIKPSAHFSISAKSANGASAATLINFLVNTVDAGKILLTDRGIPANPKVLEATLPSFSDGDKKAATYLDDLSGQAITPLPIPPAGASEITTAFSRYGQNVLFKKQSPKDAAEALTSELQAAIS